jgi:RNA polymerase primary sigma factor
MRPFVKELKITSANTDSFKQYLSDVSKLPLLNEQEEVEYATRAKEGDEDALRILIESNLRFVVSVAKQSVDKYTTLEDLVNEGNEGLIIAAQRFDPTKGFKFISYAVWWIRQRINEYKNEHARMIRLPGNKLTQVNKVKKAYEDLEQDFCREPSPVEIADHLDMPVDEVNRISFIQGNNINSLDKPIDDDGFSLLDMIPNIQDGKSDEILRQEDRNLMIEALLGKLKERDKLIIKLCYGLSEHKPLTLQEIGDMVGISREMVRQIRDKSLIRLKNIIQKKNLNLSDIFKFEQ